MLFDVELHDGNILSFDTETGAIMTKEKEEQEKQFFEITQKIFPIKWKWYEANKDKLPDINERAITEGELQAIDPENYPKPPNGFKIIPGKMWEPTKITPTAL